MRPTPVASSAGSAPTESAASPARRRVLQPPPGAQFSPSFGEDAHATGVICARRNAGTRGGRYFRSRPPGPWKLLFFGSSSTEFISGRNFVGTCGPTFSISAHFCRIIG
ncbi:hypothetical protein PVAP13_4KG310100 [Panicum virgatum]|uniref:Uncharacterized protein n=1 Tax=Panicum virgatum TaxID=38727 RepID=A0A8T0TLM5_PANVG|nr:hypothetical protein PVAP13_4KG310100 [Panicum virgatum]